ncbi:mediator of DNA damage checkpoint protein 1 isoform X2 [Podarcis raffonei]|uniref:mediator of DNA damage checkpoint protein 1 isoform X2 n=1 Tax=Podarcis raffonei TaxID=65483 RepID=UPI0023293378|nr:mediator of DNA damage checkpoint protein 1 isoform X2 [Podarcis raffonei]
MDLTQRLVWDEEGDPDYSSDGAGDSEKHPKPVGRLRLLSSKYGPEKDFWIYPGENVIGRLESCQVCLPTASVSKTHAVIEVPSHKGPHLLYDLGSLNRTRRQRMVLIPHVRYSLQDGDALLFGDVGCQYFVLVPDGADESLDESAEVPPTQKIVDVGALAIEETPAPGKRMGFGGVLVQDSDKEEDGEELVNGAGRSRHLPASDGSDSSIKDGAGRCSALGSSVFFSPSATVVPESDEENEEPSGSEPPCPSLRLFLESQDGTPSQEGHPVQPRITGTGVKSGDSALPSKPNFVNSHQDSDTGVEDELRAGSTPETPKSGGLREGGWDLEVGSDTDEEEPAVGTPDASCWKSHQTVNIATDVERGESPGVVGLQAHRPVENGDSDTDAEEGLENPIAASPGGLDPCPVKEGVVCKGAKGVAHPGGCCQPNEKGSGDRDGEETGANPDVHGSRTKKPAFEEDSDTDVEDPSLDVEDPAGITKTHEAAGDSGGDTDVEMADLALENSNVAHSPRPSSCKPVGRNAGEVSIEEAALPGNSHPGNGVRDGPDAVGERKEPDAEAQRGCEAASGQASGLGGKELLGKPESQHLAGLSVDSDTDVEEEEEAGNPDVGSNKDHAATGLSEGCIPLEKPDVSGPQEISRTVEGEDVDTDAEATSPSHKESVAEDSDTDVEGEAEPLPRKPSEEQDTQLVAVKSCPNGKKSTGSTVEASVGREPSKEDEDTDTEGEEPHPGDDSNTDEEPDLALQDTQCFLPVKTSSPVAAKAKGANCALEEAAAKAFVFQSPSVPCRLRAAKESSSFLNDDDSDAYTMEATQPFCQDPGRLLEDPTQDFLGKEEEDAELILPRSSEQATQMVVSGSASRGQQAASLPGTSTPQLPCSQPASQPVGGAASQELKQEEEAQLIHAGQIPSVDNSQPSTLADEVSGSPKQEGVTAPEGGSSDVKLEAQNEAAPVDIQLEERSSAPAGEARNSEQVQQEPAASAVVPRRRGLRSASSTVSPAPVPERPTRGRVGSADAGESREPAAPVARRQGLRQRKKPTQLMGEPEEEPEQSEEEGPSPGKKTKNREPAAAPRQGRARGSQRKTGAAIRLQEGAPTAIDSPGPRERTRRGKQGTAVKPAEEQEAPRLRTRAASRRSSCSSVSVPSPKDSGKEAKPGQEPAQSTPSSGRRSRKQSTESKPAGTRSQPRRQTQDSGVLGSPVPKVLFMAGTGEEGEHIVTELGGSLAESVFDCTHLVTDRIRRTVKFLCAMARGIPIVTLSWLEKSRQNSFFLAPNSFLVSDPEKEEYFRFKLSASLQKARQEGGVLQGYEIHVTPNVNLELEDMRNIVQCGGGKFLPRMPRAYKDKCVVISCPEDLPRCKAAQDAKLPIANAEFILTGILQQKLDVDAHRLNGMSPPSVATPPTRTRRKRAAAAPATPALPSTAKRRR